MGAQDKGFHGYGSIPGSFGHRFYKQSSQPQSSWTGPLFLEDLWPVRVSPVCIAMGASVLSPLRLVGYFFENIFMQNTIHIYFLALARMRHFY